MKLEENEIFAVEIEGEHYHLECTPGDYCLHKDDILKRGDEDRGDIYLCGECGKQIV